MLWFDDLEKSQPQTLVGLEWFNTAGKPGILQHRRKFSQRPTDISPPKDDGPKKHPP